MIQSDISITEKNHSLTLVLAKFFRSETYVFNILENEKRIQEFFLLSLIKFHLNFYVGCRTKN